MNDFDRPDRYDLDGSCDGESGSCKAKMESRRDGDWVTYESYSELLNAYDELKTKMCKINTISE